ncbi:MAG TPA: hypothetical protein VF698_04480 [Thermoanaerobaculia bacterium]|jgi:hypothetical protein
MQKNAAVLGMLMFAATAAQADWDCDHKAPRRLSTPASGVTRVVVIGRAGGLKVEGRSGATEITASGTACSSDSDFLKDMNLVASRSGSELRIEAEIPEHSIGWFGNWQASLDFTVVVPEGVALVVRDGSGSALIRNVASLDVTDGSGDLEIDDVRGDVRVSDGSGGMRITNVGGNVRLEDGSGEIDVRDVRGSVLVDEDGSGSIDVSNVRQSVTVESDGSGGIDVVDVGGDFTVRDKGRSGGIDYSRVSGRVRIPSRD